MKVKIFYEKSTAELEFGMNLFLKNYIDDIDIKFIAQSENPFGTTISIFYKENIKVCNDSTVDTNQKI